MLGGENDGGDDSPASWLSRTHPFWTLNSGWVDAVELQPGDACMDETGRPVQVLSTEVTETTCTTYNLTVAAQHSYFVQRNGFSVLVHNTNMNAARQWIVYAMSIPQPDGSLKTYVGRASMPQGHDLGADPNESKLVFNYRGGTDVTRHHVWTRFGQKFAPPDMNGPQFKILYTDWSGSGASAMETEKLNREAKHRCQAVEHLVAKDLTNNFHEMDQIQNKNIPLSRNPNRQTILNSIDGYNDKVLKAKLRAKCQ